MPLQLPLWFREQARLVDYNRKTMFHYSDESQKKVGVQFPQTPHISISATALISALKLYVHLPQEETNQNQARSVLHDIVNDLQESCDQYTGNPLNVQERWDVCSCFQLNAFKTR